MNLGLFALIASIFRSLASSIGAWLRRAICWIIQAGPKPRHLAFIMDGNRRFAEFRCMKIQDGHREGYVKVAPMPELSGAVTASCNPPSFLQHCSDCDARPCHARDLQLVDALDWCLDLGITTVSVYAFSVENFKRSRSEVDDLMALAEDKLAKILTVRP